MYKLILFPILILLCSYLFSEDIHFKNGCIYRNVMVTDSTSTRLIYRSSNGDIHVTSIDSIDRIDKTSFDQAVKSTLVNCRRSSEFSVSYDSPALTNINRVDELSNPVLYPVLEKGRLKFMDSRGYTTITPPINLKFTRSQIVIKSFSRVWNITPQRETHFHEGILILQGGQSSVPLRYGHKFIGLNASGEKVIEIQAEWMGEFSEGLAQVKIPRKFLFFRTGHRWGYVDKTGKYHIKPQYKYAGPFSEGMACIQKKEFFGFINKSGEVVIRPIFEDATQFSEGAAAVCFEGKYGYIGKDGEFIIYPKYDYAWSFKNGRARVMVDNKYAYIDQAGTWITEPDFEFALDFNEGLACVQRKGKTGYIDVNGNYVIQPRFINGGSFSFDLAPVQLGNGWGYIDKAGQLIIPCNYQLAYPFQNGLGIVWEEDLPLYINQQGVIIRPVSDKELADYNDNKIPWKD